MTTDPRERALEQLLARLILAPEAASSDRLLTWLDELGVHAEDAAALLEQGLESLLVYRRLVEGTVLSAVRTVAPTACAELGSELGACTRSYLATRGPSQRTLREVVEDFFTWAEEEWLDSHDVPAHVAELARYELALVAVESAPDPLPGDATLPLRLENGLRFQPGVRLAKFRYRVNELVARADETRVAPEPEETLLLVHRGPDGRAACLRLSPLAHEILDHLARGESLGDAVRSACSALNRPTTSALLENIATLLSDLASRGVFVGPAPP